MIIKQADAKQGTKDNLQALLAATTDKDSQVPLKTIVSGLEARIKSETEAAIHLNSEYCDDENIAIIHDVRLETDAGVGEIDHILITHTHQVYLLFSRYFYSDLRISDKGEFSRFNSRRRSYDPVECALTLIEQQINVLKSKLDELDPALQFKFHGVAIVSPLALIKRSRSVDCSSVMNINHFDRYLNETPDSDSADSKNQAKPLGRDKLIALSQQLADGHKAKLFDPACL